MNTSHPQSVPFYSCHYFSWQTQRGGKGAWFKLQTGGCCRWHSSAPVYIHGRQYELWVSVYSGTFSSRHNNRPAPTLDRYNTLAHHLPPHAQELERSRYTIIYIATCNGPLYCTVWVYRGNDTTAACYAFVHMATMILVLGMGRVRRKREVVK